MFAWPVILCTEFTVFITHLAVISTMIQALALIVTYRFNLLRFNRNGFHGFCSMNSPMVTNLVIISFPISIHYIYQQGDIDILPIWPVSSTLYWACHDST